MPRYSSQRIKPLVIAKILLENTDENTFLTTSDLVQALAEYEIPVERKSIYNDIDALRQFGLDIELKRGRQGGYYIASRDFELPELKLLVDAVQSSRIITDKKSSILIDKLSKLTSKEQAKQLNRQIHMQGRAKMRNEAVYYAIDAVHTAINTAKKISFRYFDYSISKSQIYRRAGKEYIRTPVAMCWNDDNYYLVTFDSSFEDPFASYRIDRLTDVKVIEEEAEQYDTNSFNLASYIKQHFGMFTGQTIDAKIIFHESLVSVVLDQFGSDTGLIKYDQDRFMILASVSASPVFLGWIFQFGDKVEILEPESLRDAMRDMLKSGLDRYS